MQMTDNQVKSNNALALCPFCGGEAQVMKMDLDSIDEGWKVWGVWCVNDLHAKDYYNHGHYIDNYPTEAEAIAAWNSRAERTCEFNIKDNMNETEGMGDVWIECSACNCVFDFYADEWLMKMSYCPNCGARRVCE